jgi:hypothetical protein
VLFVSASAASAFAQTLQITVHLSAGPKVHSAPTLGLAPLTIEQAMQAAGVSYTASWFSSVPGYAAMIIDGQPSSTNGNFGSPFWWACVNGYSRTAGLQTFIKGGDQVDWLWVTQPNQCTNDQKR